MISISGRKWLEKKVNKNTVEKLRQENNFSKILSRLIISRNFDKEEVYLIENDLKLINIFQKNHDFLDSVELTKKAINNSIF